jgi:hypothetical protein
MIAAFDLSKFLSRFAIKSGWIYYPAAIVFLSYLLYTMIRRRRGERAGTTVHEPEL